MEISQRKVLYPVGEGLQTYLERYERHLDAVPTIYQDLSRFSEAIPYEAPDGHTTLWQSVMYSQAEMAELRPKLAHIYAALKMGGSAKAEEHLDVERIDFGEFGNSRPFRIRIVNRYNDNFDHYYVKIADASRLFGLELEHLLSPNRINYLVHGDTLIEEHIAGIPGDIFMRDHLRRDDLNKVRVAKEFVKFNERCFLRLLGDMRGVNYVVDVTPDFEEVQYRVRPIDFDQQSYEGRYKMYLAQFFTDNFPVVDLVMRLLNSKTIEQYRKEERTLIARRAADSSYRLEALLASMAEVELSPREKVHQLRDELGVFHKTKAFRGCETMGQLVKSHIELLVDSVR